MVGRGTNSLRQEIVRSPSVWKDAVLFNIQFHCEYSTRKSLSQWRYPASESVASHSSQPGSNRYSRAGLSYLIQTWVCEKESEQANWAPTHASERRWYFEVNWPFDILMDGSWTLNGTPGRRSSMVVSDLFLETSFDLGIFLLKSFRQNHMF